MNEAQQLKQATYHLYTFLVSKMVASLGSSVYGFGMSLYILSMTGSALSFAGNMLSSIVPRILLSPIAGAITDRVSRKKLVIGGQIGEITVLCGLLLYTLTYGLSVPAIYITTAVYTIFATFSGIAFSASIPNLVDTERLQKAMSFNQLANSASGIMGPILGGMLFGFVSMTVFLLINIIALSITTVLESTMNFRLYIKGALEEVKESMMTSMKEGLRYVKNHLLIKRILVTLIWLNLFFTALSVGSSFVMLEKLKIEAQHLGFIEAGAAIGMLLTSIYFASRSNVKNPIQFSKRSILGMSVLIGGFALPLLVPMPYWVTVVFYLAIMFLFGALNVFTNMPVMVLFQTRIDENYRGRVFGLIEMTAMGFMPIGTLVYGVLYDIFPAAIILIGSSFILIAVTVLTLNQTVVDAEHAGRPVAVN